MSKTQRGTLELLQAAVSPRKEFPLELPNGDILIYTGRKLTPGHLLSIQNTVIIRAYKKAQEQGRENEQNANSDAPQTAQSEQDVIDSLDEIIENANYCAEVVAIAIIDPETETPIFTAKQAMELLPPDYNQTVTTWALEGARKQEAGENADEVDRFHPEDREQEPAAISENPE